MRRRILNGTVFSTEAWSCPAKWQAAPASSPPPAPGVSASGQSSGPPPNSAAGTLPSPASPPPAATGSSAAAAGSCPCADVPPSADLTCAQQVWAPLSPGAPVAGTWSAPVRVDLTCEHSSLCIAWPPQLIHTCLYWMTNSREWLTNELCALLPYDSPCQIANLDSVLQEGYGKCEDSFITSGNFCQLTCGHCPASCPSGGSTAQSLAQNLAGNPPPSQGSSGPSPPTPVNAGTPPTPAGQAAGTPPTGIATSPPTALQAASPPPTPLSAGTGEMTSQVA